MTHDVTRWHCHFHPTLRNSGDTVEAHTARVFQMAGDLCLAIGIEYSPNLRMSIKNHDLPYERIMGDWPATLTREYCVARWAKRVLEWQIRRASGISKPKLTRLEAQIEALCDSLDAVLWARKTLIKAGDLTYFQDHFADDIAICSDYAARLGPKAVLWLRQKIIAS